jgi:hypothetical protein
MSQSNDDPAAVDRPFRIKLACFHARAGHVPETLHHRRTAIEREPRARDWANEDSDLDSIRDAPE